MQPSWLRGRLASLLLHLIYLVHSNIYFVFSSFRHLSDLSLSFHLLRDRTLFCCPTVFRLCFSPAEFLRHSFNLFNCSFVCLIFSE